LVPRCLGQLDRDGLLADGAVAADRVHDALVRLESLSREKRDVHWGIADVPQSDVPLRRQRDQLWVVSQEAVEPVDDLKSCLDRLHDPRLPVLGHPPAGRGDSEQKRRGFVRQSLLHRVDDGRVAGEFGHHL
jgi:hypothetical protein